MSDTYEGETFPDEPPADAPQAVEDAPERTWEDYAGRAIYALYPHLREGVDFAWGKLSTSPDEKPRLLYMDEKFAPIDMGAVEAAAQKLLEQDPYANPNPKAMGTRVVDDPSNSKLPKL